MGDLSRARELAGALVGFAGVAVIVVVLRLVTPTPGPVIAALVLLLAVLGTATVSTLRGAVTTSLAATLAFNFFFLPPLHTFSVADPQNWVALFVFLAVATIASHLSTAARQRAVEGGRTAAGGDTPVRPEPRHPADERERRGASTASPAMSRGASSWRRSPSASRRPADGRYIQGAERDG